MGPKTRVDSRKAMMTMRTIWIGAFMLVTLASLTTEAVELPPGWMSDLEKALERGRREKRPVVMHLLDDLSSPSRDMHRILVSRSAVKEELANFIVVEIDWSKRVEEVKKLGFSVAPTVAFYDPEGAELFRHRIQKKTPPHELAARMRVARQEMKKFDEARAKLKLNPSDRDARLQVGSGYVNRRREREAVVEYRRILVIGTDDRGPSPDLREMALAGWSQALLSLGMRKMTDREWEEGVATLEELIQEFPLRDEIRQAYYYLAKGYHKTGRDEKAIELLKELAQKQDHWGEMATKALEGR